MAGAGHGHFGEVSLPFGLGLNFVVFVLFVVKALTHQWRKPQVGRPGEGIAFHLAGITMRA
jgi:hypothetical protein